MLTQSVAKHRNRPDRGPAICWRGLLHLSTCPVGPSFAQLLNIGHRPTELRDFCFAILRLKQGDSVVVVRSVAGHIVRISGWSSRELSEGHGDNGQELFKFMRACLLQCSNLHIHRHSCHIAVNRTMLQCRRMAGHRSPTLSSSICCASVGRCREKIPEHNNGRVRESPHDMSRSSVCAASEESRQRRQSSCATI